MNELQSRIAADLLKIQAVFLRPQQPFTWASGIKSPIYCDNRLTLSDVAVRGEVENGLAALVREHFPTAQALFGTSTAGIAHAALAAQLLSLPMGYVRSGAKDHGRQNRIEGRLTPGERVVVVEDLISTGGSAIETAQTLRAEGAQVLGIVCIFTYNMKRGLEALAQAQLETHSLTDLDSVVQVAAQSGYIAPEDAARVIAFRNDPSDESWTGGIA